MRRLLELLLLLLAEQLLLHLHLGQHELLLQLCYLQLQVCHLLVSSGFFVDVCDLLLDWWWWENY